MRVVVLVVLIILIIVGIGIHILDTGYPYTLPVPTAANTYIDTHDSQECIAKQNEANNLTSPLEAKADNLADIMIAGPFPINNGEKLFHQYDALQKQIKQINSQYSC
jgi:hypothetical protein